MMVAPLFSGNRPAETVPVVGANSVGRDNSGTQIISQGDVYFGYPSASLPRLTNNEPQNVAASVVVKPVLKLIPHGDNSPEVILEVLNLGDPVNLTASLRILSVSTGNVFKGFAYEGLWSVTPTWQQLRSGVQERSTKKVWIDKGQSKRLRIASTESESRPNVIQEMTLSGIDESIRWDFSPDAANKLPFFTLQISLFGRGINEPITRTFKVGPKTYYGPLQMTEVQT
jgi:hypothetical protein